MTTEKKEQHTCERVKEGGKPCAHLTAAVVYDCKPCATAYLSIARAEGE